MELIIKPTIACDFSCSFCSSSEISDTSGSKLDITYIKQFLKRFPETNTIIVNGGEPLMMKPSYYWEIIEHLDSINSHATLSFTSNLWNFYNNPSKWVELFKHPRIGISTSFNYGDTRTIAPTVPYTEKMFWNVSNRFLELIGYRPDFIAVINDDNYDTALDHIFLAKSMEVECKLNYVMASGRQSKPLILAKIYQIYLLIIELGLEDYEYNSKQLLKRLSTGNTTCPQNRNCDSGIRALNPDGNSEYYSCGSIADDRDGYSISFEEEMSGKLFTPLNDDPLLNSLKSECLTCPLFKICNGCFKTIKDMKEHNIVEDHCKIMKSIESQILNLTL